MNIFLIIFGILFLISIPFISRMWNSWNFKTSDLNVKLDAIQLTLNKILKELKNK